MTSREPHSRPAQVAAFAVPNASPVALPASGQTDRSLGRIIKFSLLISATRCLLTYVLIPVLSPLIQPTLGAEPRIAIPLSGVALWVDARAVRGFWRRGHRWRWKITAVYGVLMAGIVVLLAQDLWRLVR
jgi:hypothetical protein